MARPLGSVKRICQAGNRVVFDEAGSYIENKNNGEVNWLREEDGNYIMDLWIIPIALAIKWVSAGSHDQR